MDYKQEGEADGKKGQRTACVYEGIQGGGATLAEKREKPISQTARDLGVNENMLRRWIRQTRQTAHGGLPPFPGHGRPRDEELARLRKENRVLREANEILKKAVPSSRRQNPGDGVPVHVGSQ
jgi:transposase